MKKILMVATGGTIASIPTADGLTPALSGCVMLEMLPALQNICQIDCNELMSIDSSNLAPADWIKMGQAVFDNYNFYDGFVITHGTDTMAYTAAALSYILKSLNKPVIITGAQLPIEAPDTDAKKNLLDAFLTACDNRAGVYLTFYGNIHYGSKAKKIHSENFIGFESINAAIAGEINSGKIIWHTDYTPPVHSEQIELIDKLEENICVLKLIPGLSPKALEIFIDAGYRAVIIEGFGAGGVPNNKNNFLPIIKKAIEKNITIVCATQCLYDGTHLDKYPVGILAARAGAVSGTNLSTEELTIKLMIILAQTNDHRKIKQYIEQI